MRKGIFVLMVLAVAVVVLPVCTAETNADTGVTYRYFVAEDGTAVIRGYNGTVTELAIPAVLDGYDVTSIGGMVFYNNVNLTRVIIPDGVTTLGEMSFYGCKRLTSVTIPQSVTGIGERAFSDCERLTSVVLSDGETGIDHETFVRGERLTSGKDPEIAPGIGKGAFSSCERLASIEFPGGVTGIGDDAFSGCAKLAGVALPEGVTTIGDYAFNYCDSMTSITFPESLTYIGDYAFYCCRSLASLTLPARLKYIGEWAFSYCESLTEVTVPASVDVAGDDAFSDGANLRSAWVPASLSQRSELLFRDCPVLEEISFYGEPAGMEKFPSDYTWTQDALRDHLGMEPEDFIPSQPGKNVCLLAIQCDPESNNDVYAEQTRKAVIESSASTLSFTGDPDKASILVMVNVSFPNAGVYSGGGKSVTAYSCEVSLIAHDMCAREIITSASMSSYLGNAITVSSGTTEVYAPFPHLDREEMQEFVKTIVAYAAAR